jgi:hypothetical protein
MKNRRCFIRMVNTFLLPTDWFLDRSFVDKTPGLVTRDTLNIGGNLMQNRRCFIRNNETIDTFNYYLQNMGLAGRLCRDRMGELQRPCF